MRIRRRTSHLLGSAYSTSAVPPPLLLAPLVVPELRSVLIKSQDLGGFFSPAATPKGPCKLNRSPWELLDDLSLYDPQEVDGLLDTYCVNMDSSASHLTSANMVVSSVNNKEMTTLVIASSDKAQLQTSKKKIFKKATMKVNKEGHTQKNNVNVKKEKGEVGAALTWKCKKNDGKGWKCPRNASRPNSLCEYHLMKKRPYLNLEFALPREEDKVMAASPTVASKSSCSSNAQKKAANTYDATEGFYYYNGFGPSHGKKHCKNHPKKEEKVEVEPYNYSSPPKHAKVETEDGTNDAATTRGDDVCRNNNSSCDNVNTELNKNSWKLLRKLVRVRSLMSM